MKLAFLLAVALVSSAQLHAGTNVGFSTYGRAKIPSECKSATIDAPKVDDAQKKSIDCDCVPILPRFIRPQSTEAKEATVGSGDTFIVTLKSVWMGNFKPEWRWFSASRSQFALIAKAFQYSDSDTGGGMDFSPQSITSGRVIYFSDDVRSGQFLNFGQLIISGPVNYLGNPVAISLFAVEVDTGKENERNANLISTLAALGRGVAIPASPVLNVLETIGTTLVRQNKDDLSLRYDTISLDAQRLRGELPAAFLAYGDYILVRSEKRGLPLQSMAELFYNPTEGRLYADNGCKTVWAGRHDGDAYAVVQVNRQNSESKAANYQNYESLKALLETATEGRSADLKKASDAIVEQLQTTKNYKRILVAIKGAEAYAKEIPSDSLKEQLHTALDDLEKAIGGDGNVLVTQKLTSEQISILINRLRTIAGDRSEEISASAFKASVMQGIFNRRWSKKTN